MNFRNLIFWENDDYIAVDKPGNLSTLQDRDSNFNLLSLARKTDENIKVCHRLDKETSGILIFAKNDEAYRHMAIQFEHRKVCKVYHAVVMENTNFAHEVIDKPIFITGSGRVKIDKRKGKKAVTEVTTIKNYHHHSLIMCQPHTGKKHQIRIHLASVGHPIVSDRLYGGADVYLSSYKRGYKTKEIEERPLIRRMALHAYAIEFKDLGGKKIALEIPYPKDFRVLIKQLEKYSPSSNAN